MGHLVYLSETLRFQVHVFMFMNKISMSQTAFLQDFYKDQSLQRSRAFGYIVQCVTLTSQLSDSRWLLGGVQVQTAMSVCSHHCALNAIYHYLSNITTGPCKELLGEKRL